jgi:hypothetical protein
MWKSFYLWPRTAEYLILGAELNLLIDMRPILMISVLPRGDYNLTSGCHGDSMSANFSPPVCSPTGEAGKNAETGFMRCFSELPL